MIRTDDIWTFQMLTGAMETLRNLRTDVSLARMVEEGDQVDQANVSDDEGYYLDNLQILHRQMDEVIDRVEMTLQCMDTLEKTREYQYLVGVHYPDFADQDYLRDRDEWIVSESAGGAIKIWLVVHKNWIRPEERKMVKVFESKRVDAAEPDPEETDFMTEEQFELFMDKSSEKPDMSSTLEDMDAVQMLEYLNNETEEQYLERKAKEQEWTTLTER